MSTSPSGFRNGLNKVKYFLWDDNSFWSWIVDIVLSFVIIKFIVYPVLGMLLATSHPIVAVVSGSMEHDGNFSEWWDSQQQLYDRYNISKDEFRDYPFHNGFNTGDIMILKGKPLEEIERGNVLVFWGHRRDPIIHRVVSKTSANDSYYFSTKGDHNPGSNPSEKRIEARRLVGYREHGKGSVAVARVPYLGYLKIGAMNLVGGIV